MWFLLVDFQPPAMDSAANARLFMNAANGVIPFDIASEQIPVIDMLIEGPDLQF